MENDNEHETETATPKADAPVASTSVDEVKTAEEWAHLLGHLPQFRTPAPPKEKPKKVMARIYNPKHQLYVQAKNHHGWPVGKELTRQQYLEAVKAAGTHVFR